MDRIKPSGVAGLFYTKDKDELLSQLNLFKKNCINDYSYKSRAVIVPHAGYYYSGILAYEGIQYLNKDVKTVFIFAPAHYKVIHEIATSSYDEWATPLGNIKLNREVLEELKHKFHCEADDEAFTQEHSIEVQIPILQEQVGDIKIVPILVGGAKPEKIMDIIDYYWENQENAFVISSDLSHFLSSTQARQIDNATANMIETLDTESFHEGQACGRTGICGLIKFVKSKKFSLVRVGMLNSGDITDENNKVVGYGSWFLYEGEKNKFIKDNFADLLQNICKKSIQSALDNKVRLKTADLGAYPEVLNENGACFVTLEINGSLRGCIGSIIAYRALVDDLIQNAYNSAFSDPRFNPLTAQEFENLTISISLLSSPEKIDFKDEDDLLAQIVPYTDGIIIRDSTSQAVYLPSVWEQLPDKRTFLNSLKEKAGLSPDYFSNTLEAFRFSTEYLK